MNHPLTSLADFHNHLVPAVDDGPRTLDEAVGGVRALASAGFSRVVTTPHIDASLLERGALAEEYLDRVSSGFEAVRDALAIEAPGVELRRGHEVRLDQPRCDFSDVRLRLGGTSFVLVEWAHFRIPIGTPELLGQFADAGFNPIIAHPERYRGIERALTTVRQWREAGAYLQLTYGSVSGRYGPVVRKAALALLREGLVDYLATDFHGREGYTLHMAEAVDQLETLGGSEQLQILGVTNPNRLLDDLPPLAVPQLEIGTKLWERVRRIFE